MPLAMTWRSATAFISTCLDGKSQKCGTISSRITTEGPTDMGKRSNFERHPADFYPTPRAAVMPLIPHLRRAGILSFAEPCAGEGDLVRHLEGFGLRCVWEGEIRKGRDALGFESYGPVDAIITNPPFSRKSRPLMYRLILHFRRI